ncbi:PREDICTED: zinc finger BED domain-containing protein RICESLEEPER 2-like [Brassica oleracea var. oleracea]|uniref:zinc finger BED domain-containing protein RICESLEEPER 2-like n=1 Tax=Brassica oleracea var. oleracea TaxID=109376 RepID=UPI0006A6E4D0|nr:PREDICTED: zinc finger BED domain-containing protein RICESLEEPER 2-like [Brassica oleracea var. oleracea]
MDADILNLNDDDYLSVEDIMAENEDDQNAQADQKAQDDSVQSVAHTRDLEWSRGALISEFLSPFVEMTKLVSDSSYPTANLYFMQVWKIESWLRDHATSEDESICEMVQIMKLKFDKYWDDYSDILSIAAVLDPKLKFKCLEYCYNTLNPVTSKAKIDCIRKKMEKLFRVYKKNTKTTTTTASETTLKNSLPSGYGGFYALITQNAGEGKTALDVYLAEPVMDTVAFPKLNVLKYWKNNKARFKELSRMAFDVLCIPITTVSSELSFSAGSWVLTRYRSRLLPSNVQALICTRNWLRGFEPMSKLSHLDLFMS